MIRKSPFATLLLFFIFFALSISCSKSGNEDGGTPPSPVDKCTGKTISLTTSTTNAANCTNSGGITVTATGSTNFTYKLNANGTFQASNIFANIAAGTHTVFVKDGDGCERSASVAVVNASTQAGPLFAAVRTLITGTCQSCHNSTRANGGLNLEADCNIVASKTRIKVRAVDENSMPPGSPLSAADKKKITDWITAGGQIDN